VPDQGKERATRLGRGLKKIRCMCCRGVKANANAAQIRGSLQPSWELPYAQFTSPALEIDCFGKHVACRSGPNNLAGQPRAWKAVESDNGTRTLCRIRCSLSSPIKRHNCLLT